MTMQESPCNYTATPTLWKYGRDPQNLKIQVKKLNGRAKIPTYAHDGDAAIDLYASESRCLYPGERLVLNTGLSLAIPEGYAGFILPRSGHAKNNGVTVLNSPGLIDSNYRGEIGVVLINQGAYPYTIKLGQRIAQLVIQKVPKLSFVEVQELPQSNRGENGFGSSGDQ